MTAPDPRDLPVPIDAKLLPTTEALADLGRELRAAGRRIVWTNGCFDLLHEGHVRYLEAARRLGDVLVVGVNDDASVRALKGPGRPLNPLAARMAVLAALASVDHVAPFSEPTPLRAIELLRPDVLAKGGDYAPDEVVGAREVRSWGGEVVVLPYWEGRSTSALVARIRAQGGAT